MANSLPEVSQDEEEEELLLLLLMEFVGCCRVSLKLVRRGKGSRQAWWEASVVPNVTLADFHSTDSTLTVSVCKMCWLVRGTSVVSSSSRLVRSALPPSRAGESIVTHHLLHDGVPCYHVMPSQVACLSFLIYNLTCTLLQSNLLPLVLLPHDMVKQGLQTIRQANPPPTMASLAFLLATATAASGPGALIPPHLSDTMSSAPPSLHIATAMRPLLPGIGNSYSLFQVWLAVLVALAFHELGHALAARAEGLSVQSEWRAMSLATPITIAL